MTETEFEFEDLQPKATYHHGELAGTLMQLALEAIAKNGTEKLSLRALARQAGVSPTAPYRHFPTKQSLLAALASQGFDRLGASNAGIARQGLPVEERLVQICVAYINFAMDNPTTYHLMFGSVLGDFSDFDMLNQAASMAYDEVHALICELIEAKNIDVDPVLLGGVAWSFVHGMASLLTSNINVGHVNSKPMLALDALRVDPEAAVRLHFKDILGDN